MGGNQIVNSDVEITLMKQFKKNYLTGHES
jgi:hypothetical protein